MEMEIERQNEHVHHKSCANELLIQWYVIYTKLKTDTNQYSE